MLNKDKKRQENLDYILKEMPQTLKNFTASEQEALTNLLIATANLSFHSGYVAGIEDALIIAKEHV